MPITSSGQIALIADIAAEFTSLGTTDVSMADAGVVAGLPAGEVSMTDFYDASAPDPGVVVTNAASSVTTTSMTANGDVTSQGGATVTERGFYFGTNATYTSNTKYTVTGTTGSFSRAFTSLTSNTTYYITAYVINAGGESVGSTVTQATAYNYTFVSSQHSGADHQTISFNNANGVWQQIYYVYGNRADCRDSAVGFQNRFYSNAPFMRVWFNAAGGCNAITMTNVTKSSSYGQLTQQTDYWEYANFPGYASMYWYAS